MRISKADIDSLAALVDKTINTGNIVLAEKKHTQDLPVEKRKKAIDKKEASILGNEDSSGPGAAEFDEPEEMSGTKVVPKPRKVHKENLNSGMSKPQFKSKFDLLWEEVMDDEAALGLDVGDDMMGGEDDVDIDLDGDEDTVSISLPRDLATKLLDALTASVGDEEGLEGEDEFGGEDDFSMDDDGGGFDSMGEAVESEAAPSTEKLTGKDNKVALKDMVSSGEGDGHDVNHAGKKDGVANKGKGGQADRGNMVVNSSKTGKGSTNKHAFSK